MLGKWKKAAIHLECMNSMSLNNFRESAEELRSKLDNDEINQRKYDEEIKNLFNYDRLHGTALFIHHNSKTYLITARHVLFDEDLVELKIKNEIDEAEPATEDGKKRILRQAWEDYRDTIFDRIFRVPSYDEMKNNMEYDIGSNKLYPKKIPGV